MALPHIEEPSRSFRERVRGWAELETYMVLCHSDLGVYWAELDAGSSKHRTIDDIAEGQHHRAVAVYCAHEGRFDDVSEDIARAALSQLLDTGWIFEHGLDAPRPLPALVTLHVTDAGEIVAEAAEEARREAAHMKSERIAGVA